MSLSHIFCLLAHILCLLSHIFCLLFESPIYLLSPFSPSPCLKIFLSPSLTVSRLTACRLSPVSLPVSQYLCLPVSLSPCLSVSCIPVSLSPISLSPCLPVSLSPCLPVSRLSSPAYPPLSPLIHHKRVGGGADYEFDCQEEGGI